MGKRKSEVERERDRETQLNKICSKQVFISPDRNSS